MKKLAILFVLVLMFTFACGYGNVDYVKFYSDKVITDNGFINAGYQGYEWTPGLPFSSYGMGLVWYTVKRYENPNITYEMALMRWGNEIHIYNLKSIDAIGTKK